MHRSVQLDDSGLAPAIDGEIDNIRASLGRSSKLRDLFDYLVDRSRSGAPPREVEIAQDVFGRAAQPGDDGGARVYIHRLRRRLEEIYGNRKSGELRIALPLGEYRLVAELGEQDPLSPHVERERAGLSWRSLAYGAAAGMVVALLTALLLWPSPTAEAKSAAAARSSPIWREMFANGRSIVIAEGDHYLFAEKRNGSKTARLIRDFGIRSREELDNHLLANPEEASRYADAGQSYIPTTVPRAQQYLSPILAAAPMIRVLPASQVPAAAMLSQNIVYLGLTSGLGPLHAPVQAGSRFELPAEMDVIRDRRTGRRYDGGRADGSAPRRQYGLVSLFGGKEGNRYVVLAGTSEMGLVGLVETLSDPKRLRELADSAKGSSAAEALYEVDSQGAGVLAVRLLAVNRRDQRSVWTPPRSTTP